MKMGWSIRCMLDGNALGFEVLARCLSRKSELVQGDSALVPGKKGDLQAVCVG